MGDPHQVSDHTQTNWNGVIGEVGLRVTDAVWLEDVQVYPDLAARGRSACARAWARPRARARRPARSRSP
ncbi:MAG: hypothetical protein U0599_22800 [Vicinamibacteria bacterium]